MSLTNLYIRLKAYEDTGIEPEEIKRLIETNETHMRKHTEMWKDLEKYLKAESEGRLVVLPCKVGDTVFYNDTYGNVYEAIVQSIVIDKSRTIFITSGIGFDEIMVGKTVFLTREEAEAALMGGSDR